LSSDHGIERVHGLRLSQIETFYWAARLGSFARAAKHLNATQSAVSMRIQEIEARLGHVLFDRSQRSAQLTSEGLRLLPFAEQVLGCATRLLQVASDKQTISGYVRLGVAEVVALTWFPAFVEALRERFPQVQLEIEVALSYVLEEKLAAGMVDMVLAPCELSPSHFLHRSLGAEPFQWMCSPRVPGIPDVVTPAQFMELPLLVTSRELQLRGSILRWINENNVAFRAPTICNTFTIAGNLAIAGMGVAFLPLRIYEQHVRDGHLRAVRCTPAIGPLEHFVVRPLAGNNLVHAAVEDVALQVAAGMAVGTPQDLGQDAGGSPG
jgi:DNA-binding transcriptional LysR family regulator